MTTKETGLMLVLAAVTLESFAQMCLKIGAGGKNYRSLPPAAWMALGIFFYGGEIAFYTAVLHCLDVSVAFPLGSLCFVGVAVLSKLFLGETVGKIRWLGVGCILAGTVFLAL